MDDFCYHVFDKNGDIRRMTRNVFGHVTFFAHNGARFDFNPLVSQIREYGGQTLKVTFNGTSILCVEIDNIKMMDSYRFLQMPFEALPSSFRLVEMKKGSFPYLLCNAEIDKPSKDDFEMHFMKKEKKKEFEKWYKENIEEPYQAQQLLLQAGELTHNEFYDIMQENIEYCRSDVEILCQAWMKFLNSFYSNTGVMPSVGNMTIASLCNQVWRYKFLKKYVIGLVPNRGYINRTRQSAAALTWLWYLNLLHYAGRMEHFGKDKGEKKLPLLGNRSTRVDGYLKEEKKVLEFYGCYWHGCRRCCPPNGKHEYHQLTFEFLFSQTMNREESLRQMGWDVESIWECEWRRELEEDKETADFFKTCVQPTIPFVRPCLDPKDALKGGRVDCTRMYWDAFSPMLVPMKGMERVLRERCALYIDVTSLYPYVNKYGIYPTRHPHIMRGGEYDFDMTHPIEDRYFGFVYCRVLPPRDLFHPVLPLSVSCPSSNATKLMFVLCRTCAKERNFTLNSCQHDEQERSFEGTFVTTELDKALEKNYKVLRVFEIWNYPNRREGLFADYINHFLKGKQEAAGWPEGCTTDEKKQEYIRQNHEREGVLLDKNKIPDKKNNAEYNRCKLCLNSFWGKMAESNDRIQHQMMHDSGEFFSFLANKQLVEKKFAIVDKDTLVVSWRDNRNFALQSKKKGSNVHAAFTTALARLVLYSYIKILGPWLIYNDTDLLAYVYEKGKTPDVKLGNYLGEMADELKGFVIANWDCGGPKNYAYLSYDPNDTSKEKREFKCKGIRDSVHANENINFDIVREAVLSSNTEEKRSELHSRVDVRGTQKIRVENNLRRDPIAKCQQFRIKRNLGFDKDKIVELVFDMQRETPKKVVSLTFNKRCVVDDGVTYPFGYKC